MRQVIITSAADRDRIAAALPDVDVLVNNAAVVPNGVLGTITQAQLDSAFATNLFAPIHLAQLLLSPLRESGGGSDRERQHRDR
jgi:3-oxoacyl-[acyl-carrier protein] reductase